MLIAIDGPAASGKGTVARMLAKHFGLEYLDTGKLYRAVGYNIIKCGIPMEPLYDSKIIAISEGYIKVLSQKDLQNPELDTEIVGAYASYVSAIPAIRQMLFDFQRNIASNKEGAVLDGRDIGTVIAPDANHKFFITADTKIRANRRYKQLLCSNKDVIEADILRDILARDERDSKREVAPLRPASDAIIIDSSASEPQEVFEKIRNIIQTG